MKVRKELPVVIARRSVQEYFGGALSPRYLANLNCQGRGPKPKKIGKLVVYETTELLRWLKQEKNFVFEEGTDE